LRKTFESYIPYEILWRQKEQFSDGVGYGEINYLKNHAESAVTDEMMKNAKTRFPNQTPSSKEEYYCREIFDGYFTSPSAALTVPVGSTIACSTPTAFRWSKEFAKTADPSGRAVKDVHEHSAEKATKNKNCFF
jgi:asparagine synthase (glutamine-hydrolysing)